MLNNFYEKLKKFIKEYYKNIIFLIVFYIIFMWPVNYCIITGGGIMEIGDRIVVEDAYKSKGSLNLAYVSEIKATTATYLLSYIIPNWKRVKAQTYTYDDSESLKDVEFRGEIDLLNASDNAIKNAFLQAGKTYAIKDSSLYVYYVDTKSPNKFKVGDKILKVDDKEIKTTSDYKDAISNYSSDDSFEVLIERNNHEKKIKTSLYKSKNKLITGIYINQVNSYKTYPKVTINFKDGESGPSGGLMEALDIYNKLTKKDITKGLKIAGTGEIDSDGNILTIGGVKYKLLGAAKQKADIFLVPNGENYKECLKVKKKNNLKIKIIGVSTLKEAIEELNKLKK